MREALYYQKTENGVRCNLCPHFCYLSSGRTGLCGVRTEKDRRLYSENYGICAAMALDPIEKKPLYHFFPGSQILSVGTWGCNLDCGFCQNQQLVRIRRRQSPYLLPRELADYLDRCREVNPVGIAYTYSEPGMWLEYILDAAGPVKEKGYKNVLVTNGYLNPEPLRELLKYVDAFNIDVKAFSEQFYQKTCAGRLKPVLSYVEEAAAYAHVELTYLVIPTLNDHPDEVKSFCRWVAAINPKIPVHFTRYYPGHRFTLPPASPRVMAGLQEAAREILEYVYLGNLPPGDSANTRCPRCGFLLVDRSTAPVRLFAQGHLCPGCARPADIVLG